jgi:hypothetical protein
LEGLPFGSLSLPCFRHALCTRLSEASAHHMTRWRSPESPQTSKALGKIVRKHLSPNV